MDKSPYTHYINTKKQPMYNIFIMHLSCIPRPTFCFFARAENKCRRNSLIIGPKANIAGIMLLNSNITYVIYVSEFEWVSN